MMPLRGSCQACGSGTGEVSPGSVIVIGATPPVAVTTTPPNWADRVSRVSQPSNPRPLTTKSGAAARSRAWSGFGSKTCASESGPIRLVTATSPPPIWCTMSSRMLKETTTRTAAAAWVHQASIKQRAARQRLPRTSMVCHITPRSLRSEQAHDRAPTILAHPGHLADRISRQRQDDRAQSRAEAARDGRHRGHRQRVRRNRPRPPAGRAVERRRRIAQQRVPVLHRARRHRRHSTNLFVDRVKGKIPYFTRVAIETTGLADPAPILHTLMTDPIVAARYMLDGVVTTADAGDGAGTLDKQPEAVKRAAVADRLLLTKTDIAEPGARQAIEARLKELNPSAAIVSVAQGAIDSALLFNIGFYDPTTKSLDVRRWLRDESF